MTIRFSVESVEEFSCKHHGPAPIKVKQVKMVRTSDNPKHPFQSQFMVIELTEQEDWASFCKDDEFTVTLSPLKPMDFNTFHHVSHGGFTYFLCSQQQWDEVWGRMVNDWKPCPRYANADCVAARKGIQVLDTGHLVKNSGIVLDINQDSSTWLRLLEES
jgi:hypothetical protein